MPTVIDFAKSILYYIRSVSSRKMNDMLEYSNIFDHRNNLKSWLIDILNRYHPMQKTQLYSMIKLIMNEEKKRNKWSTLVRSSTCNNELSRFIIYAGRMFTLQFLTEAYNASIIYDE